MELTIFVCYSYRTDNRQLHPANERHTIILNVHYENVKGCCKRVEAEGGRLYCFQDFSFVISFITHLCFEHYEKFLYFLGVKVPEGRNGRFDLTVIWKKLKKVTDLFIYFVWTSYK